MRITSWALGIALAGMAAVAAESGGGDKNQYNLFNPTPGELLRPMNSEQFEKVFNPFTVDAGHVQIEADLVDFYHGTRQGTFANGLPGNVSQDTYVWAPAFKIGLWNHVDFEVAPSYFATSTSQTRWIGGLPYSVNHTDNDFGKVVTAVKVNLWGNDEGATALAVRPYLSIPTQGGNVLGGADIPFAVRLPWEMVLNVFAGAGAVENPNRTLYVGFNTGLALEKTFAEKLTVFGNLSTVVTTEASADWAGYAGFGVGYNITRNLQIYGGMRFGFEAAYDYNPYGGLTLRF